MGYSETPNMRRIFDNSSVWSSFHPYLIDPSKKFIYDQITESSEVIKYLLQEIGPEGLAKLLSVELEDLENPEILYPDGEEK